jgi:hypothetical protein
VEDVWNDVLATLGFEPETRWVREFEKRIANSHQPACGNMAIPETRISKAHCGWILMAL